jgi:TolB-like protein
MVKKVVLLIALINIIFEGISSQQPIQNRMEERENIKTEMKKGVELFKKKKFSDAELVFQNILKKESRILPAEEMLALIALYKNENNRAKNLAISVLKQDRQSAIAHLVLAKIAFINGNRLAARDHFRKARNNAKRPLERELLKTVLTETDISIEHRYLEKDKNLVRDLPDKKSNLAVFTFEDRNAKMEQAEIGETVSEMLITALMQNNMFTLIERTQMDKLLEEQALGLTGAIDDETAVEVGNLIGVNAIVVGSISRLDKRLELDARVIDVNNGEVLTAASSSADSEDQIRDAVTIIAQKIVHDASRIIPDNRENDK